MPNPRPRCFAVCLLSAAAERVWPRTWQERKAHDQAVARNEAELKRQDELKKQAEAAAFMMTRRGYGGVDGDGRVAGAIY